MKHPQAHPDLFDPDIPMMVEVESTTTQDTFHYEKCLLKKGWEILGGIDEAGRGALAGPVVAAVVVLPKQWITQGLPESLKILTDSKQLKPEQRDELYAELTQNPEIEWASAAIESDIIDQINILQATHEAMRQAVHQLATKSGRQLDCALIDGLPVKKWRGRQLAIKKGDLLSSSIAAASIIAKVTRDRTMIQHSKAYPHYKFDIHKGYGVKKHLQAIQDHGLTPIHRKTFRTSA